MDSIPEKLRNLNKKPAGEVPMLDKWTPKREKIEIASFSAPSIKNRDADDDLNPRHYNEKVQT